MSIKVLKKILSFDLVSPLPEMCRKKILWNENRAFYKSGHHRIMYKENYEKHPKYLE